MHILLTIKKFLLHLREKVIILVPSKFLATKMHEFFIRLVITKIFEYVIVKIVIVKNIGNFSIIGSALTWPLCEEK